MMTKARKRRTPDEAREAILTAAQALLTERGIDGVKVVAIAQRAGVAPSNILHHFGGIADIHLALVERMLGALAKDIARHITPGQADAGEIDEALASVYRVLSQEAYARLVAWIILADKPAPVARLRPLLTAFSEIIETQLRPFLTRRAAKTAAQRIVHLIAVSALGDGLVGPILRDALPGAPGSDALIHDMTAAIVFAALGERPDIGKIVRTSKKTDAS